MTTQAALAERFLNVYPNKETRKAYARDLKLWLNFLDGREPTEELVVAFRDWLAKTYKPNGSVRVWVTMRSFARFALNDEPKMLPWFTVIKGPRRIVNAVPKVPTDDDVQLLMQQAAKDPQRLLVVTLLLNGLRASEVAGLKKKDMEWHVSAPMLRVLGKGNKERLVPATYEAMLAYSGWMNYANQAQKDSEYVVSDDDGSRMTLRQIQHCVYKSAEYAGIEGMHPHALRHHYATRLIRSGVSQFHVQQLLGHASIVTTGQYVGLDLGDLIEASRMDPRNRIYAAKPVAQIEEGKDAG